MMPESYRRMPALLFFFRAINTERMIRGQSVYLRPALPEDALTILEWENNPVFWHVTETPGPFTLQEILRFINDNSDLFVSGQIRLLICTINDNRKVGMLDLFD